MDAGPSTEPTVQRFTQNLNLKNWGTMNSYDRSPVYNPYFCHQMIKVLSELLIHAFIHFYRHTNSAFGTDMDAAAMEFERRFHISVDDSQDRDQQVHSQIKLQFHIILTSDFIYSILN